jgi:hypothetical protein
MGASDPLKTKNTLALTAACSSLLLAHWAYAGSGTVACYACCLPLKYTGVI